MSIVKPFPPRFAVTDDSSALEVVIPAKKNPLVVVFLGFWLVGWFFGEVLLSRRLLASGVPELFVLPWLGAWTVGGLWLLYIWLWMLVGKERVRLQSESLLIRKEVLGIGRSREFDLAHIQRLRAAPVQFSPFDPAARLQFWGVGGGLLAFDYGSKTVRFGVGLNEAEARSIASALLARNPGLGRGD